MVGVAGSVALFDDAPHFIANDRRRGSVAVDYANEAAHRVIRVCLACAVKELLANNASDAVVREAMSLTLCVDNRGWIVVEIIFISHCMTAWPLNDNTLPEFVVLETSLPT